PRQHPLEPGGNGPSGMWTARRSLRRDGARGAYVDGGALMIDLTGKSALVTGGARGIGRACCLMLARAGASVAVNYRVEAPSANLLVDEIEALGGEAFALSADVSKRE